MQRIAIICENAVQSADDAVVALQANGYVINAPTRTEIAFPAFNCCYVFLDRYTAQNGLYDYVVKKGWPTTYTVRHWEELIKKAPPTPAAILTRGVIQYLGGISAISISDYDIDAWSGIWGYSGATRLDEKCQCGTTITLGADDQPMFHSTFCCIYTKWKKDTV